MRITHNKVMTIANKINTCGRAGKFKEENRMLELKTENNYYKEAEAIAHINAAVEYAKQNWNREELGLDSDWSIAYEISISANERARGTVLEDCDLIYVLCTKHHAKDIADYIRAS